ncbi:Down syndrome cell adhesion molecule-like protein Dscam2 [Hyalella azteca]|uniref:Down syndrome cell adhesion molecule-like protein Dscam2 n=1 Tax=Hyalella azteca TaxID=294128 RepID=A0A8B7NV22_HYAAZ|nr:Down syndrome cell adhesion molecule-like protein Dscam2 [Hyalella azteca]
MLEWLRVGVPTADQDPGPPVVMVDINNVSSYYLNRPFADLAPGKPASITLEKSRRGPTIKVITSSADRRSEVVVSNLQPARRYSVSVRAGNSQGVGPAAPEVSFTTDEDSPSGPPVEVVCRGVTSSTIVVSWSPPDEDVTNGIIVNYRVAYQRLLGSGTLHNWVPVLCFTAPPPASPPSLVSVIPLDRGKAGVLWRSEGSMRGRTSYHRVSWIAATSEQEYPAGLSVNTTADYATLEDLPDFAIKVWVTAMMSTGETLPSPKVLYSPRDQEISGTEIWSVGQSVTVDEGETVRLPCLVRGEQLNPIRVWTCDGDPVQENQGTAILANGNLYISSARQRHSGSYDCTLPSAASGKSVTYTLKVLGVPSAPRLQVIRTTNTSALLHWTSPPRHDDVPPLCYTLRHVLLRSSEGSLELTGVTKEEHNELSGVAGLNDEEGATLVTGTQLLLEDLLCGSNYSFTVTAHNSYGSSPPSLPVDISTKGSPPTMPANSRNYKMYHGNLEAWTSQNSDAIFLMNSTHVFVHINSWHHTDCKIMYFSVHYKQETAAHWTTLASAVAQQRVLGITGFVAGAAYSVKVTLKNNADSTTVIEAFPPSSIPAFNDDGRFMHGDVGNVKANGNTNNDIIISSDQLTSPWLVDHSTLSVIISLSASLLILVSAGLCFFSRRPINVTVDQNVDVGRYSRDVKTIEKSPVLDDNKFQSQRLADPHCAGPEDLSTQNFMVRELAFPESNFYASESDLNPHSYGAYGNGVVREASLIPHMELPPGFDLPPESEIIHEHPETSSPIYREVDDNFPSPENYEVTNANARSRSVFMPTEAKEESDRAGKYSQEENTRKTKKRKHLHARSYGQALILDPVSHKQVLQKCNIYNASTDHYV